MSKISRKINGAMLVLAMSAQASVAATAVGNLTVTATVIDTCVVVATPVAFASLDASAATTEVTPGEIVVTCTSSKTGVTVALNGGENLSGAQRRMDDGNGNFVPYDLHSDSGHSSEVAVNGNIFNGDITAAVPTAIDVYGEVPSGAYNAGVYADTVLITVTY
ncbi:MAG: spore coat U domain-containing protein [Rhodobacter sp.]|nr:spore coat U domain-containing protein [Rhodobacter sp.]